MKANQSLKEAREAREKALIVIRSYQLDIKEHEKLLEQHRNDIENGVYKPGESFKKTEELFDKLRELNSGLLTTVLNLEKIDYFINKNE